MINIIPFVLVIFPFVLEKIYIKIDDNTRKNISVFLNDEEVILPNIETGIPNTIHMLKILLPIILPTKISCSFFRDDIIVVTSSGSDVPIAIIVSDIILSVTPIFLAILVALSTTKSLPRTIAIRPNTVNNMAIGVVYFEGSSFSSILFLDIEII